MIPTQPIPAPGLAHPAPLRETIKESLRFWERGRILYDGILVGVVAAWLVLSWPHFRPAMNWTNLGILIVLGLIMNLFYCAAYLVDLPLMRSEFAETWRKRRWILWLAGMLFAILATNYWIADEIYPYV